MTYFVRSLQLSLLFHNLAAPTISGLQKSWIQSSSTGRCRKITHDIPIQMVLSNSVTIIAYTPWSY